MLDMYEDMPVVVWLVAGEKFREKGLEKKNKQSSWDHRYYLFKKESNFKHTRHQIKTS